MAGEADDTAAALLNFDGISYAKGASALRQLVAWVGDEAFLTALRQHFDDHAYGNATLADLVAALTEASGRDVGAWADSWLRTSGVSTLGMELAVDDDGRYSSAAVLQTSPNALRPHQLRVGLYDLDGVAAGPAHQCGRRPAGRGPARGRRAGRRAARRRWCCRTTAT